MATERIRDREAVNIRRMRDEYPREFALAEDTLDLAARIFSNRNMHLPNGDEQVGVIALGLIIKIITVFWEIIAAAERALPTSSQVRELAEAAISVAYLLEEDSPNRAQLYADRQVIQASKDINHYLSKPTLKDEITPEMEQQVATQLEPIIARWGKDKVKKMRGWSSWGGSLLSMAEKAGLLVLYVRLYTKESRAAHALDITSYVRRNPDGSLTATLPELARRHLIPSTSLVFDTMVLGMDAFKIDGFKDEIEAVHRRIMSN